MQHAGTQADTFKMLTVILKLPVLQTPGSSNIPNEERGDTLLHTGAEPTKTHLMSILQCTSYALSLGPQKLVLSQL